MVDQGPEQVERSAQLRVGVPRDARGEARSDARPAEKHRCALLRQFPPGEEVDDGVVLVEAGL